MKEIAFAKNNIATEPKKQNALKVLMEEILRLDKFVANKKGKITRKSPSELEKLVDEKVLYEYEKVKDFKQEMNKDSWKKINLI